MRARVSSAAPDRRCGRAANCARSIASVNSGRVRICHPSPSSTSSTPCPFAWYVSRISPNAARTAAGDASASRPASSSTGTGRLLAKSAASSSLARGFTCDHQGSEGGGLAESELTAPGQFQECEECRQHLPRLCRGTNHVVPARPGAQFEHGADGTYRTVDVEGARNDVVQVRLTRKSQHAINCCKQLTERERQRRRRWLNRLRRGPRPGESRAPILGHAGEVVRDLANLLVFEQPPDEFRARIFPRLVALVPRKQHLRLDAQQARGHLEVLGRLIDRHGLDARQELFGDACDGDVVDVDALIPDQGQQQVERPLELLQLDDKRFADMCGSCRHRIPRSLGDLRKNGRTASKAGWPRALTGNITADSAFFPASVQNSRRRTMMPYFPSC